MNEKQDGNWKTQLSWGEATRTLLCMSPMLVAYVAGYPSLGVPLGQAGFFIAAQPISKMPFFRLVNGLLFLTVGLGLYLIGGTVVFTFPVALLYTFLISLVLSLMSGWRLAAILSFSFFSVYSAGLNSSSPDKLTTNFYAFALAIVWGTFVSLPRWWKGVQLPPFQKPTLLERAEVGTRMGIATTIAFTIGELFHYTKMGWAPSAAASVIRFENEVSKKRAIGRLIGTIIGALGVLIMFTFVPNTSYWVFIAFLLAGINGLVIRINKLGFLPFYTTIILILYSLNDPSMTTETAWQRVVYNIVGISIATLVVLYPFPKLMKRLRNAPVFLEEMEKAEKKLEG